MTPSLVTMRDLSRLTPGWGTLAAGLVCALVAWVLAGLEGLLAGVLGTLLVVAFFASGTVPLFLAGQAGLRARAGVALLLMSFALRLVLVLAVLALAARSDLIEAGWLGIAVIVCSLVWSALQAVAVVGAGRST